MNRAARKDEAQERREADSTRSAMCSGRGEVREKRRAARREESESRDAAEKKAVANNEQRDVRPQQQAKRDVRSGGRSRDERRAAREQEREKRERANRVHK